MYVHAFDPKKAEKVTVVFCITYYRYNVHVRKFILKPFHTLKGLYLKPERWAPFGVYFENQVLMCTLQITKTFWHEKDENLFRGCGYAGFERKGIFQPNKFNAA